MIGLVRFDHSSPDRRETRMPDNDQRASRRIDNLVRILSHQVFFPFVGSAIAVAYATGRWDLSAVGTGLAITGTLAIFWRLDRTLIHPRLERIPQDWLRLEMEIFVSLAGHLLGALLALVACGYIFGFEIAPTASWMLLVGIMTAFPILHGAEMAVGYYRQLREKERVEQELRTLAAQAELKALKAQINPHFFFNALNTIAALIHTDPVLAERSIERLATMFRYVLTSSERGQVPLEEELAFVDNYLEIERARFGERLRVTRQVAPDALPIPVPSLILQPLVENAVKHGHTDDGRIDLDIQVELVDGEARIAVADQGPGMPAGYQIGDGLGHGLRNVDERLRKTYGHGLQVKENEPRGTVMVVRVPTTTNTPLPSTGEEPQCVS
jgi:signal transduction histidine kinase